MSFKNLVVDLYGGVHVAKEEMIKLGSRSALTVLQSVDPWLQEGRRAVWVQLPVEQLAQAQALSSQGFEMHHAKPEYLMMTRWLGGGRSRLPPYAHTSVGVGALVVNSRREILSVRERHGLLGGRNIWKLPTGLVDAGEVLSSAAKRECLEETGLEAEFEGLLGIRHTAQAPHGGSDLYFLCKMQPIDESRPLVAQPEEIEEVRWLPVEEYVGQPLYQEGLYKQFAKVIHRAAVETPFQGILTAQTFPLIIRPGEATFFSTPSEQKSTE